jgi:hypothetical protein
MLASAAPDPAATRRAIDIYLKSAYDGELPLRVRSQLKVLESWKGPFIRCGVFAADPHAARKRYYIRLGNQFYPHMKLAIELPPTGETFIYRVDTHDRHCIPERNTAEHEEFMRVVERNQKLAEEIETALAAEGLPTFKTYLRDDLKRRGVASS